MTGTPTGSGDPAARSGLLEVLEEARRRGFLGPGPVLPQVARSEALAAACPVPPTRALDLGAGGGIPGLVLAQRWPESRWVLLDSQERRTRFLGEAVAHLHLEDRVEVRRDRAEAAGRDPELRHGFDLVVARSFASPPVTAECGAPFLQVGGRLVVAEPPEERAGRWPAAPLARLGLTVTGRGRDPAWVAMEATRPCPPEFPRRTGQPAKRPLWAVEPLGERST